MLTNVTNTEFDKIKMLQPYENNLNLQFQTNDLVVSKPLLDAIKLARHLSSSNHMEITWIKMLHSYRNN